MVERMPNGQHNWRRIVRAVDIFEVNRETPHQVGERRKSAVVAPDREDQQS